MQCISCNVEVSTKWKHAINTNQCPFCGEIIMDEDLKELLSNLQEIYSEMEARFPDHLQDWLKQNVKGLSSSKKSDREDYTLDSNNRFNDFMSRTDNDSGKVNNPAKALAEKAKKLKAKIEGNYISDDDEVEENSGYMEEYEKIQNEIFVPSSKMNFPSEDEDDDIPPQVRAMAARGKGRSSDHNAKDLHRLNEMQEKQGSAADKIRPGGGGGFSRG